MASSGREAVRATDHRGRRRRRYSSLLAILAATIALAPAGAQQSRSPTPEQLAERRRSNGIRVVLSSVLPAYDYRWRPGLEPAPKIVALNAWMKAYAARVGAVYLDYHTAMADERGGLRRELGDDGVHPNEAGYRVMGPLAVRAIAEASRQR